jgi:hypothetical protein
MKAPQMKTLACLPVLLLLGCAGPLPVEKYEGACARQCLAIEAQCIGSSPLAMQANCRSNAQSCLSTCPLK